MKKLVLLLIIAALGWLAWQNRQIFHSYVNKDLSEETKAVGLAEKSAKKEKSRVTQGKAIDATAGGESVTEGMSREDVRGLLGDPTSVDQDTGNAIETWHYEILGKKVVFRSGRVWSFEAN